MAIQLKWTSFDRQNKDDIIKIYRKEDKDSPHSEKYLRAPLGGGVHEYLDKEALDNKLYYYCLVVEEYLSYVYTPKINFSDYGPGSKSLIRGDWSFGIMDYISVNSSEIPSFKDINTYGLILDYYPIIIYKCCIGGKIILIPDMRFIYEQNSKFTVDNLYRPDIGSDYRDGLTIKKASNFLIRLPYMVAGYDNNYHYIDDINDPLLLKGEWSMLTRILSFSVSGDSVLSPNRYASGANVGGSSLYYLSADNVTPTINKQLWYFCRSRYDGVLLGNKILQSENRQRPIWLVYEILQET